ncbi:MAG: NADH-quinone oxidoreductase subunit N [Candidatus Eremiobacteraeota bacterium]|nr:NADH-quinone oxidoreductase subunit N [Candidatus Eremiobacteraeota bacterium]
MSIETASTLVALSPDLVITVGAVLVLLTDLFQPKSHRSCQGLAAGCLLVGLICSIMLGQTQLGPMHPWASRVLVADSLAAACKGLICLLGLLVVLVSYRSFDEEERHHGEYYTMILFVTLGMLVVASCNEFLTFFVAFELLSIPLYMLVGFRRYEVTSAEAGLKYFLTGAASSAMLLFGISWIYGATGTTQFSQFADAVKPGTLSLFLLGLVFVLVALGFKISAAPFHMWAPDAYQGGPTPVVALLSTAPKAAMLVFILRLFANNLNGLPAKYGPELMYLFAALATLSVVVGNLVALPQNDLRRLLAYSGVAQIGYILIGVMSSVGNPEESLGAGSVLFYLLVYTLTNVGLWTVVQLVGSQTNSYAITDLAGLSRKSPFLSLVLLFGLLSLAGAPPFSGFIGKVYLFRAAFSVEPMVVVVGVVGSVISLYYYFGILKLVYFDQPDEGQTLTVAPVQKLVLSLCLASTVVLGLWPSLAEHCYHIAEGSLGL